MSTHVPSRPTVGRCYAHWMCGRYVQYTPVSELEPLFGLSPGADEWPPRYNITPGSPVLACRVDAEGRRELATLHWGLIPSWAKDRKIGHRTINARAETVAEKPAFRSAFKRRRCLIPANGFYEWKTTAAGRQPHYFTMKDGTPFAFAGLWEEWIDKETGEHLPSCTIIVTEANELVRSVHDRMPVILPPERYTIWLDPAVHERESLEALLIPYPSGSMVTYPVDRRVNTPANDDASLIEPMESG